MDDQDTQLPDRDPLDPALTRLRAALAAPRQAAWSGQAILAVLAGLLVAGLLGGWVARVLGAGGVPGADPGPPVTTTAITFPGDDAFHRPVGGAGVDGAPSPATPGTAQPAAVVVHVAGAVLQPGVYTLGAGDRTDDAVRAAGGATPEADLDRLNLAAPVTDGARIYVARRGETTPPELIDPTGAPAASPGAVPPATGGATAIDLNRASATELESLPGIGPTLAGAIVRHREQHGPFRSVDGLLQVSGIGPSRLAQIRDLVTVG